MTRNLKKPTRTLLMVALMGLAAQAIACKAPAGTKATLTGNGGAVPETVARPGGTAGIRTQRLTQAELDGRRKLSAAALRASGMTRTEVAVLKAMPVGEMVAMGWTHADTQELTAWTAADASKLGMDAQALVTLQHAADGVTNTPARKALDAAPGQAISAAAGGVYLNADGDLKASIPPGALSKDTTLRIARLDTADFQVPNVVMPGVRFAVDLGGATLAPGTSISVKLLADARTISDLMAHDKAFTPTKYNLAQDANGAWLMTMPVRGPVKASVHAPTQLSGLPSYSLFELGSPALPPGPVRLATSAAYRVADFAPDDGQPQNYPPPSYGPPCADPAAQFVADTGHAAPTSMKEWFAYEHQGVLQCGTIESTCCGLQLLSSLNWPVGDLSALGCASSPAPTPTPTAVPSGGASQPPASASPSAAPQRFVADLAAHVTFTSDDPSVDGQPAAGATVHFDMLSSAVNGPGEVVADSSGGATTFGPIGSVVNVLAFIALGPRSSAAVEATIRPGQAPIALQIEKLSPAIDLLVETTTIPVPPSLSVHYTLDGVAGEQPITILVPGGHSANAQFSLRVPDDGLHALKITSISSAYADASPARRVDAGAAPGVSVPAADIQRNGSYRFAVSLFPSQAK